MKTVITIFFLTLFSLEAHAVELQWAGWTRDIADGLNNRYERERDRYEAYRGSVPERPDYGSEGAYARRYAPATPVKKAPPAPTRPMTPSEAKALMSRYFKKFECQSSKDDISKKSEYRLHYTLKAKMDPVVKDYIFYDFPGGSDGFIKVRDINDYMFDTTVSDERYMAIKAYFGCFCDKYKKEYKNHNPHCNFAETTVHDDKVNQGKRASKDAPPPAQTSAPASQEVQR